MTATQTEETTLTDLFPYEDDGDTTRLTHIVSVVHSKTDKPGMSAQDIVDWARMTGNEVVALCGYKWVPVHDPEKYPLCGKCHRIAQEIMKVMG